MDRDFNHSDSRVVEKTVRCSKAQWVCLFASLRHMNPDSDFSREVAAQVNKALGQTPIIREDLSRGQGYSGEFPPDQLKSDLQEVNRATGETDDGDIKFVIATWVPVQLELMGMRMEKNGCGVNERLGKMVDDLLKVQVAYIEKPDQVAIHKPQEGQLFEAGDVVWCQLKYRRFWNLYLVISNEVAESGALVEDKILVDHTLKGNSQYLLLPAVRRRCSAGLTTPAVQSTFTLASLMSPAICHHQSQGISPGSSME